MARLRTKQIEVEGILLLDSEKVSQDEWEKHVDALHDFFGDQEWNGDNCAIYWTAKCGGKDVEFDAQPGQWVVRSPDDGSIIPIDKEEFEFYFELVPTTH